jgi:hypothetical protein
MPNGASYSVTAAKNANITVASTTATKLTFAAGQQAAIDGHAIELGDVILLTAQTAQATRGPWVVTTVGEDPTISNPAGVAAVWDRPNWWTTNTATAGSLFSVDRGTTLQGSVYAIYPTTASDNGIVVGTTNLTVVFVSSKTGLPVSNGGTGSINASGAKLNLEVQLRDSCKYATAAALPANTSGATTITGTTNAALSIDGVAVSVGDRILVKDETSTANNGIYNVTATGSVSAVFILTRSTDYNSSSDINVGDIVPILLGTQLANTSWIQKSTVATIGTSPITFEAAAGTIVSETFITSGTWKKPANAKFVNILLIGGGAGGGGGAKNVGGTSQSVSLSGGGGGGGGGVFESTFAASIFASSVSVTIGAQAFGGAGAASDGNGTSGGAGGITSFGSYVQATGGSAGAGGKTSTNAGVTGGAYNGNTGGSAGVSAAGGAGGQTQLGGSGGGGGGGCNLNGTTQYNGGTGGAGNNLLLAGGAGGTSSATAGGNGSNGGWTGFATRGSSSGGGGGGGCGSTTGGTGNGGNGGQGGPYGSGGGGGGSTQGGGLGGNGGSGSGGLAIITTYF